MQNTILSPFLFAAARVDPKNGSNARSRTRVCRVFIVSIGAPSAIFQIYSECICVSTRARAMYYRIIFHPLFPHSWKNRNQIRGEFSLRVEEGYIPNGPGTFRARKKAAKKSRLQISTRARANEQRDSLESRQANTKRQTYARTYRSSPFLVPASFFSISPREKSRILSRPRGHRFFAHHFVSFFPPRVRVSRVCVSVCVYKSSLA